MKLVDNFYCIQTESLENSATKNSEGVVSIKTELIRPSIKFLDNDGSIISAERKIFSKRLVANPFIDPNESFSINELMFLSNTYGFEIEEHPVHKGYNYSILRINKLYNSPGEIILIEQQGKEYVIIEFKRWSSESQPRSAGEDSLGEDITYILGIWESPLLTDEIITKIKGNK